MPLSDGIEAGADELRFVPRNIEVTSIWIGLGASVASWGIV
jgi:hypothetical protein